MATATKTHKHTAAQVKATKAIQRDAKNKSHYQWVLDNPNSPKAQSLVLYYVNKVRQLNAQASTPKTQKQTPFEKSMAKAGKKKVAIIGTGIMSLPNATKAIAWYAKNYSTAKRKQFNRLAQSGKKRPAYVVEFYSAYQAMTDRTGTNNLLKAVKA